MSIPILADEMQRLEALRALDILDTPAEKAFDDLAALAAVICQTKSATISLVEEYRQSFKSRVCLPALSETPRDIAFCAHAIAESDVFVVPEAKRTQPRHARHRR